ncbi:peptidylprolyl isomerase [Xanthomonas campestris]|uniref:peptidylprolyl isomerase n=1 Tax=Xanthomonas campestris TaxID=339 RepID=UPI00236672C4|nr:peptidylprolyl isomerase [Xanthomonas campestris]MEA9713103.1 peptidylprolyl isomerase [Xanthomonas campestris]MEA9761101.1 peptidylprolyl isomerase [Xanthomonas campestris pv. raphani]MEA9773521.1 peptidylprolyl isomerase [Xanthomonas campestris pv. raphani]MEA9785023.1 peptidylprolyl isomerase [Xanthomonas campestris pv. raphani]MEA9793470.1 peptidylprolyl isomerase [Xanthomonas campestris pv. raphani]
MLQSLCLSGALVLGLIAGVPSAQAATADSGVSHSVTTVLQIGKQAFTAPEYRALALADLPRGANPAGAADPAFVRAFADRRLLLDQARQVHLQDDPVVAVQLRQATDAILADAMQRRARTTAHIDAAQVQAQFNAHPHDYDEVRLSHLFVALQPQGDARRGTPLSDAQALARAQQLKRQLDSGTPFEELAKRESDDGSTAAEGGELSSIFLRNVADVFAAPVQALGVGDVSAPVRGPEGYHLIRVDARIPATLETARGQIEVQLREQAATAALERLRQANPLQFDHAALEAALR